MNEELDKKIKKQGLINGLILGGILSAVSILYFYFMILIAKTAVMITVGSVLFSYVLPLGIALLLCGHLRKKIGGLWTMRQAATGIFIMLFASYLVVFVVKDQIFARAIEPAMAQKTENAMLNALNVLKKSTPANEQKEVDAKIADMKTAFDAEKDIPVGKQIQAMGISIIFLFVLSIIFAAFYKTEGPAFGTGF